MAGVDTQNQFPNSMMANAVKLGQSRIVSDDVPDIAMGQQIPFSVAASQPLTVPTVTNTPPLVGTYRPGYAVVTAIAGTVYFTIDGTVPSSVNNAGQIAAGASIPLYGLGLLQAVKFQGAGASISVAYYR